MHRDSTLLEKGADYNAAVIPFSEAWYSDGTTPSPPWWNSNYSYRKKITFDNAAQTENLLNFPVLIKLNSSRVDYNNTQDSGQDIRFVDDDGTTVLSHEIEKWNETGDSYVWVKVPQIDGSSDTDYIYIYYGNPSITQSQENVAGVWDSSYAAVWHLDEDAAGTGTAMTGWMPPGKMDRSGRDRSLTMIGSLSLIRAELGISAMAGWMRARAILRSRHGSSGRLR